jgi:acyl carrier protein|tara:strand:+ start:891 stop:1112 length:222 start_codon:yes stop_codon:yes gene_type:complete
MSLVEDKVRTIIIEYLDASEDFDNASTFESIGTDSLAMMELIMEVEEQFDVEISDDIVERLKTPNDLINFLKE